MSWVNFGIMFGLLLCYCYLITLHVCIELSRFENSPYLNFLETFFLFQEEHCLPHGSYQQPCCSWKNTSMLFFLIITVAVNSILWVKSIRAGSATLRMSPLPPVKDMKGPPMKQKRGWGLCACVRKRETDKGFWVACLQLNCVVTRGSMSEWLWNPNWAGMFSEERQEEQR